MAGGKGGGGGQLPDYNQMIEDMAYWNRPNLSGPSGGIAWNDDRSAGTEFISPEAQSILDLRNSMQQHAAGQMAGGFLGVDPYSFAGGMSNEGTYGQYWNAQKGPFSGIDSGPGEEPWWGGVNQGEPPGGGGGVIGRTPEPWGGAPDQGGAGGIDSTQFLGGPFEGFGYGDQELLEGLIGGPGGDNPYGSGGPLGAYAGNWGGGGYGGGGGGGGYRANWGGGGMDLSNLTDLITYNENGEPTIGPGLISDLDLESLPGLADEGDLMGARDRAEQAMFQRAMGLIQPGMDQRTAAEAEMLANRGIVEGSDISQLYGANRDQAFNQAQQMAALDAVGAGREEYGFLSGEARANRNLTLTERLQQAALQNQSQESMVGTNLGARGQEALERYQQGQLAQAGAASSAAGTAARNQYNLGMMGLDLQRLGMSQGWEQQQASNQLAAQAQLWQQQMSERGTGFGELATLLGFGSPSQGMNYPIGGGIDVMGAAGQAGQNQMMNWQQDPLNMIMQLVGGLGGAALMGR